MKRVLFWMRGSVEWNVNKKKKKVCVCEHSTYLSHKPGTGCNSIEVSLSPLNACEMQPLTTFLTRKAVKSDTVLTSTTLFCPTFQSMVSLVMTHHLKKREKMSAPLLVAAASLACNASSYPKRLVDAECFGLQRAPAAMSSEDQCAELCCSTPSCTTYNWCADPTGTACHSDNGGCYVGASSHCEARPGWVGGQRPDHPPPSPSPANNCTASTFPTSVSGYQCDGLRKAANQSAITSPNQCQQTCCSAGAGACAVW